MSKKIPDFFSPAPKSKQQYNEKCEISSIIKLEKEEVDDSQPQEFIIEEIKEEKVELAEVKVEIKFKKRRRGKPFMGPRPRDFFTKIKSEVNSYFCNICGRQSRLSSIVAHIKDNHSEKLNHLILKCSLCDKNFLWKSALEKHVEDKHRNPKVERFQCDFCGRFCNSKGLIYEHLKKHRPKVKCPVCKVQLSRGSLNSHLKDVHVEGKQFPCRICSIPLKNEQNRKRHELTHDKKHECETCGKKYPTTARLNTHKRNDHENPGRFICEKCGKKFNRREGLTYHQKKKHDPTYKKRFQCQMCDYMNDNKKQLEGHEKSHEREAARLAAMENPLKCEICGKFYKDWKSLYNHIRALHPPQQVQCDLCGKFCNLLFNMRQHIDRMHIKKRSIEI